MPWHTPGISSKYPRLLKNLNLQLILYSQFYPHAKPVRNTLMKLIAALITPSATTTKVNYNRKPQLTLRHFKKKSFLSCVCLLWANQKLLNYKAIKKKPQLPNPQANRLEWANKHCCLSRGYTCANTHLTSQSPPANPDFQVSAVSSQRETESQQKRGKKELLQAEEVLISTTNTQQWQWQ